jgi:quinol monooxygenase YgiN
MRFEPSTLSAALGLLVSAAGPTQEKRGCKSCRVERDALDELSVRYVEEWEADEAFRRHINSDEFWPVLVSMDLCCEEPEVAIGNLLADYGMDVLRTLREEFPGSCPMVGNRKAD